MSGPGRVDLARTEEMELMKRIALATMALAVSLTAAAMDDMHGMGGMKPMPPKPMQNMEPSKPMQGMEKDHAGMPMKPAVLSDGEVRKVDRESGKLTLEHGAMPAMAVPAMTMVYEVKDAAMLDHLRAGDKVKFAAEKTGPGYTVTRLGRAK